MWANNVVWMASLLYSVMALSSTHSFPRSQNKASVFSDLTPGEMESVKRFLLEQKSLNLVRTQETLGQNTVFMMELKVPKKQQVLNFLDKNGSKPSREARVVIFFADQTHPNVSEYIVGPLPHPYYYKPYVYRGKKTIRFESRPITNKEYENINMKMVEVTKDFNHIIMETSGFSFLNCSKHCLTYDDIAPRGLKSGERRTWFSLQRFVDGFYLHPIGFELLINHRSTNPKEWTLEKIWYNGQYFDRVEELVTKYKKNELKKLQLHDYTDGDLFSTFIPRGEYKSETNINGPKVCEPQGKRYKVLGNYVEYAGWSFAYRVRTSSGLQIFDIRYNNERIAYELSLQEAIAFYAGITPASMQTKFIDSGWGMGHVDYELAKGIDCPEVATYLDVYHFYGTDKPVRYKNALCIFELPTGIPLRRHFNTDDYGGYDFYAGVENHVLVVRTTSTVYNYDYIWDFIFYQNGVIEAKVSATGYIRSSFFTPNGIIYGNKVQDNLLGNLHSHLMHYKVDLDISGTENSFETVSLQYENISIPWSPTDFIVQKRLVHTPRNRERDAAFRLGASLPKFLMFKSHNKKNKWGHQKTYRIQYNSNVDSLLPREWKEEKGVTWSRYSLAVTRHSDTEETSSSIYNQHDPWDPMVSFQDFINNNENIVNKDLVAWVTVGFTHIPHAEDIPNTATPGNSVGFFLRPFNFFNEDPSVATKSTVIVRPKDKTFTEVYIQRWTPETTDQCVSDKPFHYNGTYFSD